MTTIQSLPERNLNKRQRSNDESNDRVDIQQKQIEEQSLMIAKLEAEKEEQSLMIAKLKAEKEEQSLMVVEQKENKPQYVLSKQYDSCGIVYLCCFQFGFKIGRSCKKQGTKRISRSSNEIIKTYANRFKNYKLIANISIVRSIFYIIIVCLN